MLSTIISVLITANTFVPVSTQQLVAPGSGQVTLELGLLSEPLKGDLKVAARAWALSQRERYSLPPGSSLQSAEAMGTRFGASFHLLQTVGDVEVYGGKLVVTIDEERRVTQVASSLETYTRVLDTWLMTPEEAMRRAAGPIPLPALQPDGVPYGGAKKYLFRVGDELHAGYLTNVKSLDFSRNWYVAVDAVTGERLFVQDRVHHAALDARVYPVSPGGLDAGVGATPTVLRQLAHADGGSMVGNECAALLADGGMELSANDAGYLCGTQLMSYNCCPTAGCAPDAGAKRQAGATMFMGFPVQYDVAVCDRVRRASNVTNTTGDYVYTPVDPPTNKMVVEGSDPANSDAFAEVHSFYHVNRVYDWMRRLSSKANPIFAGQNIQPFQMRDERRMPPQKVAVWSNVMFPNFQELIGGGLGCLLTPPCRANTLLRLDNAAFFPRENFTQLPIPGFDTGVDTLMIFQGNAADAAYDATVIQHEFGHGAVYATANIQFDTIAIDTRSANNEGGALHEGFADYIAAAFNNLAEVGPYFGPRALAGSAPGVRQDSYLRTMNNTLTCPDVLWGEVHEDSQHVAAALWKARMNVFQGADQGDTFDAAFYAMLVSITPNADFAMVASVMADKVATAFPSIATARAQMTQIFTEKGVIGCSKILDVTAATQARPYYGIASASGGLTQSVIPGPFQFKLSAPNGALRVRVTGTVSSQNPLGGGGPPIQVLTRIGSPITFARQGGALVNDATKSVTGAAGMNGAYTATVDGFIPCGSDVYVTLAATGGGGTLQNVRVVLDPSTSCTPPADGGVDSGTPDSGMPQPDAGSGETKTFPYVGSQGTIQQPAAKSCGCSTPADFAPLALLLVLGARRRRA